MFFEESFDGNKACLKACFKVFKVKMLVAKAALPMGYTGN